MVGLILPDKNFSIKRLNTSIALAKKYFKTDVKLFCMNHSKKYYQNLNVTVLPAFKDYFDNDDFF